MSYKALLVPSVGFVPENHSTTNQSSTFSLFHWTILYAKPIRGSVQLSNHRWEIEYQVNNNNGGMCK